MSSVYFWFSLNIFLPENVNFSQEHVLKKHLLYFCYIQGPRLIAENAAVNKTESPPLRVPKCSGSAGIKFCWYDGNT